MRLRLFGDQLSALYSFHILRLGNGNVPSDANGEMTISPICNVVSAADELKAKVFPNLPHNYKTAIGLVARKYCLQSIPKTARIYRSVDNHSKSGTGGQLSNRNSEFSNFK